MISIPEVNLLQTTEQQLIVFVDGAAKANGRVGASAGYGIHFHSEEQRDVSAKVPSEYPQTNQVAELMAATTAMELCRAASETRKIIFVTDSKYVLDGITSWIHNWKRNAWKTATKKDVLHKVLWQRLDAARQKLTVDFVHIRGHQGCIGNEIADKLAVQGVLCERTQNHVN